MKIEIKYDSSWRNSFLDGDNNSPLPPNGRKFVGSMTSLKKQENFIDREITIDTVMGLLNRLIGDQRKLYQSRQCSNYFFRDIERTIKFTDFRTRINEEATYIRNVTGSTDQNSFAGLIKTNDPIFRSNYSDQFWGVLVFDVDELCHFIIDDTPVVGVIELNPIEISSRFEELSKIKPVDNEGLANEAFVALSNLFNKYSGLNTKGQVIPLRLYCSALYLQLSRLSTIYDMNSAKTKAGGLAGISNNNFTKKDFMSNYTTGGKKKVWGNPYTREEYVEGEGKLRRMLKKASGTLEININIDRKKAKELERMIDAAGVSSFYLGKKGLAYVSAIRV